MKQKELIRKYRFSDAALKQLGDRLLNLLDRDAVEFADRGFNANKRNIYIQHLDTFSNHPTDEQLEGIKVTTTNQKDNIRYSLEKAIRTILLMARNTFGENVGKYKEFGNTELSRQSDEDFARTAKIVHSSATKYENELADEGLTPAKLQNLDTLRINFDAAIDAQREAISNRDIATNERIKAGNELYTLIAKYCEIGKDIWYDENEAKYNDYVIYESQTPNDMPE